MSLYSAPRYFARRYFWQPLPRARNALDWQTVTGPPARARVYEVIGKGGVVFGGAAEVQSIHAGNAAGKQRQLKLIAYHWVLQ